MPIAATLVALINGLAGLLAGGAWIRARPPRGFWPAMRAGQAASVALAVGAGIVYLAGERPGDSLFWLYALLPIAVSFVAEQLRALSAETVLQAHDLDGIDAVRALEPARQEALAEEIVARETAIMGIGAAVVAFLLLRAAGTW